MSTQVFYLPASTEDGGDFFSLVSIGGGEDKLGHGGLWMAAAVEVFNRRRSSIYDLWFMI